MSFKLRSMLSISCAMFFVIFLGTLVIAQADSPTLNVGSRGGAIRAEPTGNGKLITVNTGGLQLPITGITPDEAYYQIEFEGELGWINQRFVESTEGDLTDVPIVDPDQVDDLTPEATEEPNIEPCFVSTDQPRTVLVRVGYGENRTAVTFLVEDTEFVAQGQQSDDDDAIWYALDKEEAAPGKSIRDDVVWIAADEVEAIGDCDAVPFIYAFAHGLPPRETVDDSDEPDGEGDSTEPCFISTHQPRTVFVRVGYGENRTSITMLKADTDFEVLGQNMDDNDVIWYALDKEEAAPGKSVRGDVAWVVADQIEKTGDCDAVPIIVALEISPFPPDPVDSPVDNTNALTVGVPSTVVWFDTGISLIAGQSYSISATGLANLCGTGNNPNCVDDPVVNKLIGPNGNLAWERCEGQYDPCQLMPGIYGALVGRVGSGVAFHIGTGGSFVVSTNGNLFLGFNDHKFWDNTGSYSVTISVE